MNLYVKEFDLQKRLDDFSSAIFDREREKKQKKKKDQSKPEIIHSYSEYVFFVLFRIQLVLL